MAQVAGDDYNKRCIDRGRVYQPGFAVYIKLALPTTRKIEHEKISHFCHKYLVDGMWQHKCESRCHGECELRSKTVKSRSLCKCKRVLYADINRPRFIKIELQ